MAVEDIALRRPTLDEVFLALTGTQPPPTFDRRPDTAPRRTQHDHGHRDHGPHPDPLAAPVSAIEPGASYLAASGQVAARTIKKFVRTPALIVAGTAQGVLFLLIFRYVFGGAVAHTGSLSYVDFLVPGFVVTGVLFQGMSASSGVAEDLRGRAVRPAAQPADPPAVRS